MRKPTLLIFSLLAAFMLAGPVVAAPPTDVAKEQDMRKERISGMVKSVHGQTATIRTNHGRDVQVNLGPASYWRQHGYHLIPGREVTVEGWRRENDEGPYFAGGIRGPDFYFELSNGNGFPLWADQDDYWDGWCPTWDYYNTYYFGPAPYMYGPPPAWWRGPLPPRMWYHRHHYYYGPRGRMAWGWGHPHRGFEHGRVWNGRPDEHRVDRGDGGGHGDHHDGGDHHDQRGGGRHH